MSFTGDFIGYQSLFNRENADLDTMSVSDATISTLLVSGNATISGDLTVSGTTTTINTENLTVEDPMILLGSGQTTDNKNQGFYTQFDAGSSSYAGLLRQYGSNDFYLLSSCTLPSQTAPITSLSKGNLYLNGSVFSSTADSISISTGAVSIAGGLGVSKNISALDLHVYRNTTIANVVDITTFADTTDATGLLTGSCLFVGGISVSKTIFCDTLHATNLTQSTSSYTGSIISDGGIGCSQAISCVNLNVLDATDATTSSPSFNAACAQFWGGISVNMTVQTNDLVVANTAIIPTITSITAFTDTSDATSPTTGAVMFAGGIGVAQSVFCNALNVASATDSTSTTTGAVILAGGLGVAQSIFCNSLNVADTIATNYLTVNNDLTVIGNSVIPYITGVTTFTNTTDSTTIGNGACIFSGGVSITKNLFTTVIRSTSTTDSTSRTTGGVIIDGGLGVAKNISSLDLLVYRNTTIVNVVGVTTFADITDATGLLTGSCLFVGGISISKSVFANTLNAVAVTDSTSTTTGSIITAGGLGVAKTIYCNAANVTSTTDSSSLTTGSIITAGGLGVAKTIYCSTLNVNANAFLPVIAGATLFTNTTDSTSFSTGAVVLNGGLGVVKSIFSNTLNTVATTDSSSTTTGALITAGGAGIAKKLYVGTDIRGLGRTYFGPAVTNTNTLVTTIISGVYNSNTNLAGIGFNTANDTYPIMEIECTAHNNVSITFDMFYNGTSWIGCGNGAGGTATGMTWQKGSSGFIFQLSTAAVTAGSAITLQTACQINNSGLLTANLGVSSALVTDSTSVSTGSIVTAGGLGVAKTIYCNAANVTSTTDSSSITTGSIITAGGLAVAKKIYVGTSLNLPSGSYSTALNRYEEYSALFTFTDGFAMSGAGLIANVFCRRIGKMVTVTIYNNLTYTPGAGPYTPGDFVSTTAIPASFRASSKVYSRVFGQNNSNSAVVGYVEVTGIIGYGLDFSGAFGRFDSTASLDIPCHSFSFVV